VLVCWLSCGKEYSVASTVCKTVMYDPIRWLSCDAVSKAIQAKFLSCVFI
jgi:hypothetical protein